MRSNLHRMQIIALAIAFALPGISAVQGSAIAQAGQGVTATGDKPYLVEWVYRVKYGYKDEWWAIFQKYQIATLDKEKELGYVTDYTVFAPGLHTSEDARWDYRVIITYKNQGAAGHGGEVEKQLFPNWEAARKDENRRWELTENHWDLPIHPVNPHAQ